MLVELTREKIDLIAKIIKNDRKYPNNEDLYEDFFNETCQRSMAIFDAVEDEATLETYLKKVVTSSIIGVLKNSGRLRRSKAGYIPTKEVSLDTVSSSEKPDDFITEAPAVFNTEKTNLGEHAAVSYLHINIPSSPEENAIRSEILSFVARTIDRVDRADPDKQFMQIFVMRYKNGMTQKQIANELNISQSEISKRLYGLIDKVKSVLDEQ